VISTIESRFWGKVSSGSPEQCWEWTAHTLRSGYGWFRTSEGSKGAHRVAAFLVGLLPTLSHELHVLHRCDNPKCCNPTHLFLGTNADNARDKALKNRGRGVAQFGESNPASKLTAVQVADIQKKYATGTISQTNLAKEYGMTQPAISRIVTGARWGGAS